MKKKRIKYIIGLTVIALAFIYFIMSSFMGSFRYAISPGDFRADEAGYAGKIVKLSGVVKDNSISFDKSDYIFEITDGEQSIRVHYRGIVPNTFRDGAEVMVTGIYNPESGIFEAQEVITKCASKYVGGK